MKDGDTQTFDDINHHLREWRFYTPTGTDTYIMQKMIDTISVMPGQEEVEYVWEVPKGTMCHFWALVYNADVARVSKIINIYYE